MGLKVVMTYHSKDYLRKKWNFLARMVLKMGEWIGCVFANQIICVSRTVADEIGQKYRHKTVFIPNGVTMPSAPGSRGDLVKLGLEKGKYVLTVGRIDPGKGFSDLIEAFCSSRASLTHKLVIAGRSDHEDKHSFELKQKVKNSPNVILTGFLNSGPLGELYANAALFILPSYHEGLPIVVLEAMSHGLSCVVSDIPANRELQLGEGRYFKPGDIKTLSGKLNVFLKRPFTEEEKASLFKVIAQKYNWENIAEKTMDTYNKVMGES
jgi:glycosyltransferase involved in cell wall biosynthesis